MKNIVIVIQSIFLVLLMVSSYRFIDKIKILQLEREMLYDKVKYYQYSNDNIKPIKPISNNNIIGIRNNNPMNVKDLGKYDKWLGQISKDKFNHAIFSHYTYGIRAGARVLKTYYYKYNCKTISSIIDRYCTGNKKEYIKYLSESLGVKPDEEIDLYKYYKRLIQSMIVFETGVEYPEEVLSLLDL